MPRLLLLLVGLALVVAYFKLLANVPRPERKRRLMWLGYAVAASVLVLVVVRTGAISGGVIGAIALMALRAAPALIAWKRRPKAQPSDPDSSRSGTDPGPRQSAARPGAMSRTEALQVLELSGTPSRDQVMQRYRELMRSVHPDRGGSNYLAAKLNEARHVLLRD